MTKQSLRLVDESAVRVGRMASGRERDGWERFIRECRGLERRGHLNHRSALTEALFELAKAFGKAS